MESLKGKQHKIDKNKNGKIDAHDFKLLRKEENEQSNESFDFNRAALAKQRLMNLKGKKTRGAAIANLMRSAGLKEEEMEETDLDQLDEVLSKDATASDWIHDFVHSDNPKFEGKSKAERIKMALGAYYGKAKQKQQMEEVEQVEEGVLGAVSGAIAGGLAGGPIGALAGAYLGHKVQQGANNSKKLVKANQSSSRRMRREFVELDEAVTTTHEDPLVTVHDKDGLHTHANLSVANHIFNTNVHHKDVHAGPVKTKDGHETKRDLTFALSKHHEAAMNEAKLVGTPVDVDKVHAAGQEPHEEKFENVKKKKQVKEQYDEDGNVLYEKKTFQQFLEGMTATQVRPGVTRYTGGSYGSAKGSKYGNTDYDSEDIDKKDDENQEQQKRGRGRPAGSKSGARGPRIK